MTDQNQDDRELFRKSIGKVQPLNTERIHLPHTTKPIPVLQRRRSGLDSPRQDIQSPVIVELSFADTVSYVARDGQNKLLRKLKRGFFEIQAELDLHGLSAYQAKQLLEGFLDQCSSRRLRCVHIIHGKGNRSLGEKPVLKNKLNLWLRQCPEVLAFCSASQKNGGAGAVYVLLDLQF